MQKNVRGGRGNPVGGGGGPIRADVKKVGGAVGLPGWMCYEPRIEVIVKVIGKQ